MSAERIPVIGIVGGIGSGKSALANALSQYYQCGRLDADRVGHQILEQSEVETALRSAFGDQIFDSQGKVLRSELARLVFGEGPEHKLARKKLETIVHPRIRRVIVDQLEQHQSQLDCDIILLDAALLIEAGWSNDCDAVIYVEAPLELRRQRVAERGWSAAELERRESTQLSLPEKQERADLIIDNSRDIETVGATVARWIADRFHLHPQAKIPHPSHS